MDKLKLIIAREFITKVKNRTFIVMTFLGPLLMIGMFALITYISKSSMDKKRVVSYVDQSGLFSENDFTSSKTLTFINISDLDLKAAKELVEKSDQYGLLYIPKEKSIKETAEHIAFYSSESPSLIFTEKLESTSMTNSEL